MTWQYRLRRIPLVEIIFLMYMQIIPIIIHILSAYHLYGNFGENFPSSGTGIFFGTENRNGIDLYPLQNTGKFFTFSQHEASHW